MIGAFQPKGFQGNAFQVAPVEGYIYVVDGDDTADLQSVVALPVGYIDTTDSNDTCDIQGTVAGEQPTMDMHDGFTPEEIRRAKRLDAKIRARQLALYKAQQEAKQRRKQQIRDLVDPPKIVAKQKQNKLQSIQEVKADIPSVDTTELERSIAYLENQKTNLLKAVAYRQEVARLQTKLAILEAKRLAELDDEESILLLT